MTDKTCQIYQCEREICGLRYPVVVEGRPSGLHCPRCRSTTKLVAQVPVEREVSLPAPPPPKLHLEALLDNIRSAWNVGAMLRTADGLGLKRLHLCGITPLPDNQKVTKTSLGAEAVVPWQAHRNGVRAAASLRENGFCLWALELTAGAVPIGEALDDIITRPIVLVVGNELSGVDPGILEQCERIFYIPMVGVKRSFNVAIAFGIAAHTLLSG